MVDGKRKATEEPSTPSAAKRLKQDSVPETETKPKIPAIPFPEKVTTYRIVLAIHLKLTNVLHSPPSSKNAMAK